MKQKLKCQKYFFYGVHAFCFLGILALGIFCSVKRKQAISFYFTIPWTFVWFAIDTIWRIPLATWYHKEIKLNWFFLWIQIFTLITMSALCWHCIQKAQILQAALYKAYRLN